MRINEVDLTGIVESVEVFKNDDGDYVQGRVIMTVLRGTKNIGTIVDALSYDTPWVFSANPYMIKQMEGFTQGNVIRVVGSFTTTNIVKKVYCPECSAEFKKNGTMVYISPTDISLVKANCDRGTAIDYLKEHHAISNTIILSGKLAYDPNVFSSDSQACFTNYPLIVPRNREIEEDTSQNACDFPMIRAFGRIAKSNGKHLHKGSSVLIKGIIQSRDYNMKVACEKCNCKYSQTQHNLEVVPYFVEYLKDYYTKEDIENMENENYTQDVLQEDENLTPTTDTQNMDWQNQLIDGIVDFDE